MTKKTKQKSIEDMPVITEFVDVFVYDLLRLPPVRENKFGIDIESGAAVVHKAPYLIVPVELKELNVQL